jgi:hypothetical protein
MAEFVCRTCGDVIDPLRLAALKRNHNLPAARAVEQSGHCVTCYCELAFGWLPKVTDSAVPAPGTGLTWRQRVSRGHTDGG